MKKDLFNGCDWIKVDKDYFIGVKNFKDIKEARLIGNKLEVEYYNGNIIYYQDIFGTWGNPTKCI